MNAALIFVLAVFLLVENVHAAYLDMGNNVINQPDIRPASWDTGNGQDVDSSNTVTKNGIAGRINLECQNSAVENLMRPQARVKT